MIKVLTMPKFNYHLSDVHYLMLKDRVRTLSYKNAIEKFLKSDGVVVDLGSGTGILSFFAAKKSKKVYSVEITDLIELAKKTALINGLENIEFVKSDIFDVKLEEKVDILIHEQIGDYLWDEDLIAKISHFKKYLKQDGKILPGTIKLYAVAVNYLTHTEEMMEFWSSKPYGIDFSPLKSLTFKQGIKNYLLPQKVKLKNSENYLTEPKIIYTLNLSEANGLPVDIGTEFFLKKGKVTGILLFMKIEFSKNLYFYTNHYNKNNEITHWNQIFIPMFEPKILKKDTIMEFVLYPDVNPKNWKWKFSFKDI